jgi:glutathione S-transferase
LQPGWLGNCENRVLGMQIPGHCPHVKHWYDEMQERESVQKSRPTHMPDGTPMAIAAE